MEHDSAAKNGPSPSRSSALPCTIRLENFRDGLEDLAYARLLEKKSGRVVKVPEALVKSRIEFSFDPEELYSWRNRIADALEGWECRQKEDSQ